LDIDLNLYSVIPQILILYIVFALISVILWYRMLKEKAKKF